MNRLDRIKNNKIVKSLPYVGFTLSVAAIWWIINFDKLRPEEYQKAQNISQIVSNIWLKQKEIIGFITICSLMDQNKNECKFVLEYEWREYWVTMSEKNMRWFHDISISLNGNGGKYKINTWGSVATVISTHWEDIDQHNPENSSLICSSLKILRNDKNRSQKCSALADKMKSVATSLWYKIREMLESMTPKSIS